MDRRVSKRRLGQDPTKPLNNLFCIGFSTQATKRPSETALSDGLFLNPSNSIKPNNLTFIHTDADFLSGLRFVRIVVGVGIPNQIAVLRMGEGEACAFGEGDGFADADGCAVRVESDGVLGNVAGVAGVGQTEQQGGLGVDGAADKGFRRAVLENAAFVHDGDGVGHGAGFLGGVGDEDGGDVLTADAFGGQGA